MVDKKRPKAEVKLLPERLADCFPICTPQDLEKATDRLIEALTEVAEKTVPRRRPPKHSTKPTAPWWTQEVREKVSAAKAAERALKRLPHLEAEAQLAQAQKEKTRAIKEAQRSAWRDFIGKTAHNPD